MKVCSFCHHTGGRGAKYLLTVKGHETQSVHKPCGEKLLAALPSGIKASVQPSPELRAEWAAERCERQAKEDAKRVHSFWAEKLEGLVLPSPPKHLLGSLI